MARAVGLEAAGPPAGRPEWLAGLLASGLALLCACQGEHLVLTSGDAGISSNDGPDVGVRADASPNDTLTLPNLAGACPTDAALRRTREDCWPSRHIGRWNGFFIGDPRYEARDGSLEQFPLGEIELWLSEDGVGGLVFAGNSAPPAPPRAAADAYLCAGSTPNTKCPSARKLVEGFAYQLENLELLDASRESQPGVGADPLSVGERFQFDVSLGEPWRAWCGVQVPEARPCSCFECPSEICFGVGLAPGVASENACGASPVSSACGWLAARAEDPCVCRSDGCVARERTLSIRLQMSEDGQALRGEYVPSRADLRPGRLEFSRLE